MQVVGIDPGIRNLGFVVAAWDGSRLAVRAAGRVDLTLPCRAAHCPPGRRRSRELFDRLQHLRCHPILGGALPRADRILVERQPPGGLTSVSDFFLGRWRDKTTLVSPNAMHAHFGIGGLSYDGRKRATEDIAAPYVTAPVAGRRHDVADALCIVLYWSRKLYRAPKAPAGAWMRQFGFTGSCGPLPERRAVQHHGPAAPLAPPDPAAAGASDA